jgi:hypothetical protein
MTAPVRKSAVTPSKPLDTDPNTLQTTPVIATAQQLQIATAPNADGQPVAAAPAAPMFAVRCWMSAEPLAQLSPEDEALLEPLLQSNLNYHQLAQAKSLPLLALYRWSSQPHIAAYIQFHRQAEADHDRAQARAETRQALAATTDPAEKRRLIALLLRAADRRPGGSLPAPRTPRPSDHPHRQPAHRTAPARTGPEATADAAPPRPAAHHAAAIASSPAHLVFAPPPPSLAELNARLDSLLAQGDTDAVLAFLREHGDQIDELEDRAEDQALDQDDPEDDGWDDDQDADGPEG